MDVLHTAIWVDDVEAMKAFYEDGLGLEHTRQFVGDDGVTNYFLAGESETELQFKYDDDGDREIDPSGFDHTAVAVDDVEETVETLVEEYGGELTNGPLTMEDAGLEVAFVDDPDGYGVELVEELE